MNKIDQEIAALENEAALLSPSERRLPEIKAYMLKNGFRLQTANYNIHIIDVIDLETGKQVLAYSEDTFRYARTDKYLFLQEIKERVRLNNL